MNNNLDLQERFMDLQKQGKAYSYDLINQKFLEISLGQRAYEKVMTRLRIIQDGIRCNHECAWVEPYGWVPECGCPVHDE